MRYLFGFLCVCALGAIPLVGCSEPTGDGVAEASGILDPTFDGDGIVVHDGAVGENSSDYGYDLTIDAAGRIVVGGYGLKSGAVSYHMVIWRYNADGALDPSFGGDGVVVYESATESSDGYAVKIDGAGKVVVAGDSHASGTDHMVIWRYDSDGTLDPTFGGNGLVIPARFGADYGRDCTIDAAGRILVAGFAYNYNADMVIWRHNADGTGDPSFGVDGMVVHHGAAGGSRNDEGYDLTVAAGKILVAGRSNSPPYPGTPPDNYDMVIWRYNADGTLDTSFGIDGIVVHDGAAGGRGNDYGYAITIDAAGRVLVSGTSTNDYNRDMVIWRYR